MSSDRKGYTVNNITNNKNTINGGFTRNTADTNEPGQVIKYVQQYWIFFCFVLVNVPPVLCVENLACPYKMDELCDAYHFMTTCCCGSPWTFDNRRNLAKAAQNYIGPLTYIAALVPITALTPLQFHMSTMQIKLYKIVRTSCT